MLKGFKEFIMRGNVMDLAVAVVIGAAFGAVVTSVVNSVINPLIGAVFNAKSLDNTLVVAIPTVDGKTANLMFGQFLGSVINFIIVAVVVYFVFVMPVNHFRKLADERRKKGETAGAADEPVTELDLLAEIRDLLAASEGQEPSAPAGAGGKHQG